MTIEERLKKLKKDELISLARQLNATGYSELGKESLIDHIIDQSNEQDITAALNKDSQNTDEKIPWWKRHKIASILAIIGLIGSIATIIALFLTIEQGKDKKAKEKTLQSISKKLEQFDPIKRDQIINQLKKANKELKAALKDEKSGNTEERKEAFKALNNGNPTKAQELFKKRIEKDKNNLAENYFNLGNAYYVELKIEEALEAYNKAIEIKSYMHEAWNNKGVTLDALGRREDALEAYNKAIEIKPADHEAWNNKGNALYMLGYHYEALEAYNKAIEIKPDLHETWYNKGVVLSILERDKESQQAFDKAEEIMRLKK